MKLSQLYSMFLTQAYEHAKGMLQQLSLTLANEVNGAASCEAICCLT